MTLETLPDKKTGVGGLRNPRECGDRLPPDAGYYLDLVLPRFEEPGKKTGSRCEIIAWKNNRNGVIRLHAIQSQNVGESTGNVSENTSKFTSGTN